jgi:hypothetical protein
MVFLNTLKRDYTKPWRNDLISETPRPEEASEQSPWRGHTGRAPMKWNSGEQGEESGSVMFAW